MQQTPDYVNRLIDILIKRIKGIINNNSFQKFWNLCTGLGAIIAIVFACYTYNQSERFFKIENRPIPKIVIPQIEIKGSPDQPFEIQLYNRGRNPLTNVKMFWKILPFGSNSLLNENIAEGRAVFPIVEQTDVESIKTKFRYSDLKYPNEGFLFIIVGIKSKDLLDKDTYIMIYYCSLGEKEWWKVDENLYSNLADEHRNMLKAEIKRIFANLSI